MPIDIQSKVAAEADDRSSSSGGRTSCLDAVMDLVDARLRLIQIEAEESASRWISRIFVIIAAMVSAVFAWLFLMIASVGWVAATTTIPWYAAALIVAMAHMILVGCFYRFVKRKGAPSFEHTKAEFRKDRVWIRSLQNRK